MSGKWYGSKWIRPEKRIAIYVRDQFTCAYCGKDLRNADAHDITLDHLVPRCQNGSNEASNLVTACGACNYSRQDRDWQTFAPGGAQERILAQIKLPLNIEMAKALIAGKAGDPVVESVR